MEGKIEGTKQTNILQLNIKNYVSRGKTTYFVIKLSKSYMPDEHLQLDKRFS